MERRKALEARNKAIDVLNSTHWNVRESLRKRESHAAEFATRYKQNAQFIIGDWR